MVLFYLKKKTLKEEETGSLTTFIKGSNLNIANSKLLPFSYAAEISEPNIHKFNSFSDDLPSYSVWRSINIKTIFSKKIF